MSNESKDKPGSDPKGGMALSILDAEPRGMTTVRDLRRFACMIENPDDRELVQHAADMIEVLSKSTTPLPESRTLSGATSRTDGKVLPNHKTAGGHDVVHADFARQLERESDHWRQAYYAVVKNKTALSATRTIEGPCDECRQCGFWSSSTGCCKATEITGSPSTSGARWIPCGERLPGGTDNVLAAWSNQDGIYVVESMTPKAVRTMARGPNDVEGDAFITHWMPLPAAPFSARGALPK